MKKIFLLLALYILTFSTFSQSRTDNTLLWRISGNGLKKPSYLFGTYHFLTNGFVDTLKAVKNAYRSSDAVVGELVIDSTLQKPMMEAAILKGTTLRKVLSDTLYASTSKWFKDEAGIDLSKLDQLNPVSIMSFALAITQQKYFPNKTGETQLDTYFQNEAKKDGKKVLGLETIQMQIKVMFDQFSVSRQVSLLSELFKNANNLKGMITQMNNAYISQNLYELQQLMYSSSYNPGEMKVMLEDRNNYWMQQLPKLMNDQALFVAVGALHLTGKIGLVNLLKQKGYSVEPVNIKN